MENEMREFLDNGMLRYGRAKQVLVQFEEIVKSTLDEVLVSNEEWGSFFPSSKQKPRSTPPGRDYAWLNRRIEGKYRKEDIIIEICVNWYESEDDYPYYDAYFVGDSEEIHERLMSTEWGDEFEERERGIRFKPDPDDFNLIRDMKMVLNEFLRLFRE